MQELRFTIRIDDEEIDQNSKRRKRRKALIRDLKSDP